MCVTLSRQGQAKERRWQAEKRQGAAAEAAEGSWQAGGGQEVPRGPAGQSGPHQEPQVGKPKVVEMVVSPVFESEAWINVYSSAVLS